MPTYPHIEHYRADLQRFKDFSGSGNELSIRRAFAGCLDAYCRDHREGFTLIDELEIGYRIRPDGTVRDRYLMNRGHWEAKDSYDDLDAEIRAKLNRGYPRDNMLFEDSRTAVLYQNGEETMRAEMTNAGALHRLIRRFLDYERPEIRDFREGQEQFKTNLPDVLDRLRGAIAEAEVSNPDYQAAAASFLALCRQTISPEVSEGDVREMLLQHILTKDIFRRVFDEDQFHRENNVALQLEDLERTFFTGDVRRQAMDHLRNYYGRIAAAAGHIAEYSEKQQFLKGIYEDFYQSYNPAAADRLGVVYTPNEVVDFMIRGTDWLLQRHFGRTLADDNVQILDPATGTGTFITNLIKYLPDDCLEYKYLKEIHANEVAILPYYIANLNIEYTYKERTKSYREFPNLCFVDTLDNMDWKGASGDAVQRQGALSLGGVSKENLERVLRQNKKPISVIIGNPPYNANQQNENDNNKNRVYPAIDDRIQCTYIKESSAQKTKQYDMYKRFIRWASDRLEDDGIIAFVSNSAFLDARQDDGFRKVVAEEFNELWTIDLKGNARTSGERRRQEGGNVFNDKIRVGVAIYFLVRRKGMNGFKIFYNSVDDYAKAFQKVAYVQGKTLDDLVFEEIAPDAKFNWVNQSESGFEALLPLANRETKFAKSAGEEKAVFKLSALGVNTARDEWVYDFDVPSLRAKALFFADTYNALLDNEDQSYPTVIKWSEGARNHFRRGDRIVYSEAHRLEALHRPFVLKNYLANAVMSDRLTSNHYEMFGPDLLQPNQQVNACQNGRHFYALATDRLTDWHFTGDTHCVSLYRYTPDGERVSNVTEWGLRQFRDHYSDGDIAAEDIFVYVYAMLHDPLYRERYQIDLRREFPRVHFQDDFLWWAEQGRALLDLHIGFGTAEPWPLERVDKDGVTPTRAILQANEERGIITLDEQTSLAGVPDEAWGYQLGTRSALEWVLDQYKERKPRDPTIRQRFDTFRFANHKERVINLLGRVCAVSVDTVRIVTDLAAHSNVGTIAQNST